MPRRWPTAWPAGSRAALLALCLLTAAPAARAADDGAIARAVAGFVAALSSAEPASLADIDAEGTRDFLAASRCIDIHSYRAKTARVAGNVTVVAVDVDGTRLLRNAAQSTVPLMDEWMVDVVCDAGGCRIQRVLSKAEWAAIAIADAPAAEREGIVAEMAGQEAELVRALSGTAVLMGLGPMREYGRARELNRFARQLARRSGDLADEAYAVQRLGEINRNEQAGKGLEESDEALALARASGDPDAIAAALVSLGFTKWRARDTGDLEELRAAAAMTGTLRDPRIGIGALEHLCHFQVQLGELRGALRAGHEMYETAARYGWTEGESIGARRTGLVYFVLQDYDAAWHYDQIAWQKALETGNVHLQSYAIHNMGVADQQAGRYDRAVAEFRRAVAMMAGFSGDELATAYPSLVDCLTAAGRYPEADAAVESMFAQPPTINRVILARMQATVANLRTSEGRLEEALAAATSALPPPGTPDELLSGFAAWHAQDSVGRVLKKMGRLDEAEAMFRRAVNGIEAERSRIEGTAVHFFEGKTPPYEELAEILAARGRAREALEISELLRARTLDLIVEEGRVDIAAVMTPAEKARQHDLDARLAELNRLLAAKSGGAEARSLANARDALRVDLQRFRAELDVAHPLRRPPKEAPLAVPPAMRGTLFVEYIVRDGGVVILTARRGEGGAIEATAHFVEVPQRRLESLADRFVHSIEQRNLGYADDARKLYDLLLHPIEPELRRSRRLCVIPDKMLWRLPFHVFVDRAGRHVLERMPLFYAPSIRTLSLAARRPGHARGLGQLLAFGNPALSPAMAAQAVAFQRGASVGPLPDAEREVESIRRLYGAGDVKVLVGSAASETNFKREAARYRILHIAAHGVFDERAPMFSALLLAAPKGGGEDGFLEAREIADLSLRADVVVLSACDTARGRYGAGEGLIGMSWALQVAGCPTAVVSQWKAASAPTARLMIAFHRALLSGASKPDALRRAALHLMRDRRTAHPFYWAPFIVMGAP